MLHFYLVLLISLAVTGHPSKAPASLQNQKQTRGWLDTNNETTATTVRDYTPVIDTPSVNLPTEETIWEHGDSQIRVTWDGLAGTLVKVQLLQNGAPIADVINWSDNNNSALIEGTIQSSWGSGSGFQIRVEDNIGNSLISETFRIMAPINVSQPRITTVWSHAERDVTIAWSGSPGNTVDIVLFDGEYQVANLASRTPNTGSFTYPGEISSSWGTGDNYSVRITDDIGNEYTSRHFSINAINVTSPTAGAIWSDQNPSLNISWEGGSRVVRISLYRGSTKINDLTEWIDNTGYCEIEDFLSYNLDAGSNYRIEVRDDQNGNGNSELIVVQFSSNTEQGAIPIRSSAYEGSIEGNETLWLNFPTSSGNTLSMSANGTLTFGVFNSRMTSLGVHEVNSGNILLPNVSNAEYICVQNGSSELVQFNLSRTQSRKVLGPGMFLGFGHYSESSTFPNFWSATLHIQWPQWLDVGVSMFRQNEGPDWLGGGIYAGYSPYRYIFNNGFISLAGGIEMITGSYDSDSDDDDDNIPSEKIFPLYIETICMFDIGPYDERGDLNSGFGPTFKILFTDNIVFSLGCCYFGIYEPIIQ